MEQRLIDANWLKEEIFKLPYNEECLTRTSLDVLALIDKAPIVSPKEIPIAKVEFSKEQLQEIVRQAIQKYIDHDTIETRACADCKYYNTDPDEEPCRCCCYGDGLDNWEARE